VPEQADFEDEPLGFPEQQYQSLKTRIQWRKERLRRVMKGEKPVAYVDLRYMGTAIVEEINTDGTVTTRREPRIKVRQIPLYSREQTAHYKRVGAVLLRDLYSLYFADHADKGRYLWWNEEKGEWSSCRGYLDDEKIKWHLQGKHVYGILGGDYTCFSAIDADYHGGDYTVFRDQLTLVLKRFHGQDRWHHSISPRGVHLINTHHITPTDRVRAELRRLLTEIDAQDPVLRRRAEEAGMRPISDWEVYPDPKQKFRLPLARGRVTLLDSPYSTIDLETYIRWQMKPRYCSVDEALAHIFTIIQPINADVAPPKVKTPKLEQKSKNDQSRPEMVFGPLKGRFAKVLVDFWSGRNNPPDSLNCAIALTARMMPYYFEDADEAVEFIERLIDDLPDVAFSDRLAEGRRKDVTSVVQDTVRWVYDGNGHQPDPEVSSATLTKTFESWQRRGFSLIGRSTWHRHSGTPRLGEHFNWSAEDLRALTYFAKILNVDLETTANATRQLVRQLLNHSSGVMSIKYVTNLLVGCGVKVGHHGKVNEFLRALEQADWITKVAEYVVGRRGRSWRIGPRLAQRFTLSPSLTTNPSPPSISLCPILSKDNAPVVINEADDHQNVTSKEELVVTDNE
jgi:hypothetical protein